MHNRCQLIGRLGKDPIMKSFTDGGKIAEFPLATTEQYKDKEGNWKDIVDWHNIKISNKFVAERAEKFLKKGSQIFIEGKIRTRSYDGKDGEKRYITEIIVDNMRLLDKKEDSGNSSNSNHDSNSNNSGSSDTTTNTQPVDDLPF